MQNLSFSKKTKLDILNILIAYEDRLFKHYSADDFFDGILNLRLLPSRDNRYKDALADFRQHYINNNDWTLQFIFLERFNFLDSDENFEKLLNTVILPTVHSSVDEIQDLYHSINPILELDKKEFRLQEYDDLDRPIFKVEVKVDNDRLKDIPNNKIQFFIASEADELALNQNEYFILEPTTWDDYGLKNSFRLIYCKNNECCKVGNLKIINQEETSTTEVLTESFTQLPSTYCSLAEDYKFYENIKSYFSNNYLTILKALNDVAFFPTIQEQFDTLRTFGNSLTRFNDQEQLLREAKFKINGYDLDNLYKFDYAFNGGENPITINFDFSKEKPFQNIYAIIGKNGVGKTRLISQLPLDIANKAKDIFFPKLPYFSKIIAVSYSAFDNFSFPNDVAHLNYTYCGLRTKDNLILDKGELEKRFYRSMDEIEKRDQINNWIILANDFFSEHVVSNWFASSSLYPSLNDFKKDIFKESLAKFSSGQSIFIFIMTEILANIRSNSLIIFDEPETHLHPNGISQVVNSIHTLAKRFQSFCIIATHSPIVVQGLLSRNVYILRNDSDVLSITHPFIETLGENLTILTEEIFGTREIPKYFQIYIEQLVKQNKSYDEIKDLLQSNHENPLSLNLTILIKSLIDNLKKG